MCDCRDSYVRHVTNAVANALRMRHAPLHVVKAHYTDVVYSGMSTSAMIAHAVNYQNQSRTKTSLHKQEQEQQLRHNYTSSALHSAAKKLISKK